MVISSDEEYVFETVENYVPSPTPSPGTSSSEADYKKERNFDYYPSSGQPFYVDDGAETDDDDNQDAAADDDYYVKNPEIYRAKRLYEISRQKYFNEWCKKNHLEELTNLEEEKEKEKKDLSYMHQVRNLSETVIFVMRSSSGGVVYAIDSSNGKLYQLGTQTFHDCIPPKYAIVGDIIYFLHIQNKYEDLDAPLWAYLPSFKIQTFNLRTMLWNSGEDTIPKPEFRSRSHDIFAYDEYLYILYYNLKNGPFFECLNTKTTIKTWTNIQLPDFRQFLMKEPDPLYPFYIIDKRNHTLFFNFLCLNKTLLFDLKKHTWSFVLYANPLPPHMLLGLPDNLLCGCIVDNICLRFQVIDCPDKTYAPSLIVHNMEDVNESEDQCIDLSSFMHDFVSIDFTNKKTGFLNHITGLRFCLVIFFCDYKFISNTDAVCTFTFELVKDEEPVRIENPDLEARALKALKALNIKFKNVNLINKRAFKLPSYEMTKYCITLGHS